jgi:hypothetical protein
MNLSSHRLLSRLAQIRRLRARTRRMRERRAFIAGAAAGAASGVVLAYFADPQSGRRRRIGLRDRAFHSARQGTHAFEVARRDLAHRLRGLTPLGRGLRPEDAEDSVIAQRVRSALGRVVSHPHAIHVAATEGVIALRGPILRSELRAALQHAERVRGVKHIENLLDVFERPEHVPALQGGKPRRDRFELLQRRWAPGPRLATGMVGGALLGVALSARRTRVRGLTGAAGGLLLARSIGNQPIATLLAGMPSRLFGQEQVAAARRVFLAMRPDQLQRRVEQQVGQEQR